MIEPYKNKISSGIVREFRTYPSLSGAIYKWGHSFFDEQHGTWEYYITDFKMVYKRYYVRIK
jgi:hypothetical protein